MHYVIGVAGLGVFMALAWAASYDRKLAKTRLKYVALMLLMQAVLGFILIRTAVGQTIIDGISSAFGTLLGYAFAGTSFVFGGLAGDADATNGLTPSFFMAVLMPIVFISALIGVLEWSKILPLFIRYLGIAVGKINGLGKLESYGASASLLLGQSEVFISLKHQLTHLNERRLYTLAAAAMSTVSASIMGSYMVLLDPRYVVTAIALNFLGIFIVVSLINPYDLEPSEDVAVFPDAKHRTFFETLTEYIWDGFRVAVTVAAMLIGFVALIAMVNGIFNGIFGVTFQHVLGYVFSPLAVLTGVPLNEAVDAGSLMATKLVTNEFVAMTQIAAGDYELSERTYAIVAVFLVSFANFASIGIIAGAVKGLTNAQGDAIARFGLKLVYGATLVSFISATMVGLLI
ncbi:NupC/NupG family nucleoside CNT transporter [Hoyosella rhizosphaerae]|uniref:Nucleoside permease n=1 Tax=Hoyosella rhizosphaerae TaxID=1755582 RepID=A0A916UDA7_9ACTN|nr:nucleoside transporter C-terminal domain-containing protein [Hoyosella rhizosphaerae]MBN4925928.1 NupC/NupG family nucleoside CNT transporter [Hoyosella rhizosphaerae]GGC66862.1 nucleoside permease [Hoyosella rhizosphaerae]